MNEKRDGQYRGQPQQDVTHLLNDEDDVRKILNLTGENAEFFVKKAEECAEEFSKEKIGISPTKLRDFYDYVKQMDKYDKVKLHLLKPKLAYAVGKEEKREKKELLGKFQKTMEKLIDKTNEGNFENFVSFFEAIVAYHKVHGGK